MLPHAVQQDPPSPARLLEMLVDRFGIFEAAASASITLSRLDAEGDVELPMETAVAEAVLEFGGDLRAAFQALRNEQVRSTRSSADDDRAPRGALSA